MKKFFAILLAALMIATAALAFSSCKKDDDSGKKDAKKVILGFDADYPPFGYLDEKTNTYVGFDIEYAQKVCEKLGYELELKPIDWDSKDEMMKTGAINFIWNGFTYEGRENDYEWTDRYLNNSIVVLTAENSGINTLADLAGKAVVVQSDSSGESALKEKPELVATFKNGKYSTEAAYTTAFEKLKIGSVVCMYDETANATAVIVNGKEIGTVGGRIAAEQTDGRGYTAILRTNEGELWLVRGGKIRLVNANVTDAVLASEGGVLAFRTADGVLYRSGTGKKDTAQLVSNEVPEGEPFCLSPSGKELIYTSAVGGTVKAELSSMRGGAPYLTDTGNYRPVALADKCRFIYFRDAENTLYIYNAKTARMTNCGAFLAGSLVFNRDFSEVFFKNADSCRFYKDGTALTLTGLSGGETLLLLSNQRVAQRENVGGVHVLQKSLLGCYYNYAAVGGNSLVYLTVKKGKVQMEVIHSLDEGSATVTDKYVFFLSTDKTPTDVRSNLYAVKNGKTAFERLMSDVEEYCANVDGSRILYRDAHGPLRAMRMGYSPTQLSDGFQAGTLCVTLDDTYYFLTEDGALYRSENGETPEKVADGVRFVATDAHVAFFLQENGAQYELFTNYRGRRKNTRVMIIPFLPSDDGAE